MQSKMEKYTIGFASSMFQTSGDRCGQSNWTEAAKKGSVPHPRQRQPHWDQFESDLDLMKDIGINSYRVSIEWSHVEPQKGQFDNEVVAQYQRLIEACLERNIKPMLTLYHFNEPLWFTELGGFEREENIEHFVSFSKYVFSLFSPQVLLWCTINEPAIQAFMGYFLGKFPPHVSRNFTKTTLVLKNLLKAHVDVYHELKLLPNGTQSQIGIVHNILRFKPLYWCDPIAYFLANLFNSITDDLVVEFFKTGLLKYHVFGAEKIRYQDNRAPDANDFIGLNFYANPIIGPNLANGYGPTCRSGQTMGDMYLPLDPDGLSEALERVSSLGKPIYITETGVADKSDLLRQQLLPAYFAVINDKIDKGLDIKGVYLWTAWDNYEWNEGNTKSFGFFDEHRQPRNSVNVLKQIISDNYSSPTV